jgi:hypothetical protein
VNRIHTTSVRTGCATWRAEWTLMLARLPATLGNLLERGAAGIVVRRSSVCASCRDDLASGK